MRLLLCIVLTVATAGCGAAEDERPQEGPRDVIDLPEPATKGELSVEQAMADRRSIREFTPDPLTRQELAQLFWSGQGITDASGKRTAPSAGALYPLELYAATVDGLYHYLPEGHRAEVVTSVDLRESLAAAALGQSMIEQAGATFIITGVVERTSGKYGERAQRYVVLEAGHAAQNLLLQALTLELGAVPVGAFDDDSVAQLLELAPGERPLYLIPVGHPER